MPHMNFRKPGAFPGLRTGIRVFAGLCAAIAISGCATLERLPAVTYAEARQIDILDIPDARFYVSFCIYFEIEIKKIYEEYSNFI